MTSRTAVSLIETLVVIAIIGIMLGLLFPAVQSARWRALEMQCKNNLHQIDLAIADFYESNKRLPGPGTNGVVGGWTIEVLPFLEQKNLLDHVTPGSAIMNAPGFLLRQPGIFRCPVQSADYEPLSGTMEPSSYVFAPFDRRHNFVVLDAPVDVKIPWASGPEMASADALRQIGPHRGGFFAASGFEGGVGFSAGSRGGP